MIARELGHFPTSSSGNFPECPSIFFDNSQGIYMYALAKRKHFKCGELATIHANGKSVTAEVVGYITSRDPIRRADIILNEAAADWINLQIGNTTGDAAVDVDAVATGDSFASVVPGVPTSLSQEPGRSVRNAAVNTAAMRNTHKEDLVEIVRSLSQYCYTCPMVARVYAA